MSEEESVSDDFQDVLKELTPEELAELQRFASGYGSAPSPAESHNVHKFLHDVMVSDDTTKTGNLTKDEVGLPQLPQRTLKELELFARDVANLEYFADYFRKRAEILTSTSLSKDAKLLELTVVNRRELANVTKPKKENKGWFKKRDKGGSDDE